MKYTGPKVRLSRQLGLPITPKAARVMEKKGFPPGQHGRNRRPGQKMSDFKRQLLEKQRLRAQYNIHEKQMVNYFKNAVSKIGNTSDNLIRLLESRLDALVLRSGFARTIYQARQLVSHGHFLVNGKKVDFPACQIKVNDVISVKSQSRKIEAIEKAMRSAKPPQYLSLLKPDFSAELVDAPQRDQIPVLCDLPLVIEFYSK